MYILQVRPYVLFTSSTLCPCYKFDLQVRTYVIFTSSTLCPVYMFDISVIIE